MSSSAVEQLFELSSCRLVLLTSQLFKSQRLNRYESATGNLTVVNAVFRVDVGEAAAGSRYHEVHLKWIRGDTIRVSARMSSTSMHTVELADFLIPTTFIEKRIA